MAAAGYVSVGAPYDYFADSGSISIEDPYEECFADDLIKMAQRHYASQGARVTKAVKVAHMGRAMAQRQAQLDKIASEYNLTDEEYLMVKEAIGLGGVAKFLGGAARKAMPAVQRAAGSAGRAASRAGGAVASQAGRAARGVSRGTGNVLEGIGNVTIRGAKGAVRGTGNVLEGIGNVTIGGAKGVAGGVARAGGAARGAVGKVMSRVRGTPGTTAPLRRDFKTFQPRTTPATPRPTTPTPTPRPGAEPLGAVNPLSRPAGPAQLAGPQMKGTSSLMRSAPAKSSTQLAGEIAGSQPKGPGALQRFFGGAREGFGSGDLSQLGQAGKLTQVGRQVGDVVSGAFGGGSSTMKNLVGGSVVAPAAMSAGGAVLGAGRKMLGSRGVVKNVAKAGKGAVGDIAQAGSFAPSLGREALDAAVSKGMSGRQLAAAEQLYQQGGNLTGRARKQLERMSGISYDDMVRSGGLSQAVMGANPVGGRAGQIADFAKDQAVSQAKGRAKGAVTEAGQGAVDAATGGAGFLGRAREALTTPLGGPKARLAMTAAGIGLPVAAGLGAYGLYHGMSNLAARNQQTAFQHGAYGAPINYSPTSQFPAGQIVY